MNHRSISVSRLKRGLSALLAALIGLGPLATPSYAALTALADQPLNVQNQSKPNIVLTVDDSTSMLYDFLPDSVIGKYCRDITGNMNAACGTAGQNTNLTAFGRGKYVTPGYIFQQYGVPYGAYNNIYDTSGPGSGCDLSSLPASTCFGGIDPGPLPGIERYPNPAGPPPARSPKAGREYEYWTLWPAPVHNSELNHIYYNPRLTYDPPVRANGTSYPHMNAANTSNWTLVPTDSWATSIQYVNLTTNVTVGLWCNSDWNIGHETDPAYCRTNGTGPSASSSSASTPDGDYNYPWAPPGIFPGNGPTIAKSIAWSKVDTGNNNALRPAWNTARDPKYFYETDNVLWCDATSPLWPHHGPLVPQYCNDPAPVFTPQVCQGSQTQSCNGTPQTCLGTTPQTCGGASPQTCQNITGQTCNGASNQTCNGLTAQTCNNIGTQTCANLTGQTCAGVTPQICNNVQGQTCANIGNQVCQNVTAQTCSPTTPQTCTNVTAQTCQNVTPQTCASITAQSCNAQPQTCAGVTPQTCGSISGQTCAGVTPQTCVNQGNQTCGGISAQTCNGVTPQTCNNLNQQACNGVVNQTCNIVSPVCVPPPPQSCSSDWDPPGCNLCQSECGTCTLVTTCPPGTCSSNNAACQTAADCPSTGSCSNTLSACTNNGQCPAIAGHCSITPATTCFVPADCPLEGTCSANSNVCQSNGDCPTIAGHCSTDNAVCYNNGECPNEGHCTITNIVCQNNGQCPQQPGHCSTQTQTSCFNDPQCATIPGHCTTDNAVCLNDGQCPNEGHCTATAAICQNDGQCPTQGGHCTVTNAGCLLDAQCPIVAGHCNIDNTVCTTAAQCPNEGHCTATSAICQSDGNCPTLAGHCSATNAGCFIDGQCPPVPGTCSNTGLACTTDPQCPTLPGQCSIDNSACFTTNQCVAEGTCSITNVLCQNNAGCPTQAGQCTVTNAGCFNDAQCPTVAGQCSTTATGCFADAQCPTLGGHCTITNAGCFADNQCPSEGQCSLSNALCQNDSNCPTLPGQCSVSAASCFADGQCPPANGTCSTSGSACASDAQCPAIAGACSADSHVCAVNADCVAAGTCSVVATAVCHNNGECPTVPGTCTSSGTTCTVDANCPTLAGHCSIDSTTCTADAQCGVANLQCSITGTACTSAAYCEQYGGTCSVDGSACSHFFFPPFWDIVYCPWIFAIGKCSVTHADCWGDYQCPATPGPSAVAVCSDLVAGSITASIAVPNASFETPVIANYQSSPGGASWTFGGSAGIQHYFSSFGAGWSNDGYQTAFLQGAASISQSINLPANSYRITFLAAARPYSVPVNTFQPIVVKVDGVPVGTPLAPTADYTFTPFSFEFTITNAGFHTITIAGTDSTGDKTSFIDSVAITTGQSLLEDANGAGAVCRHNNKTYGATSAARYNYPDTKYNTAVSEGTGANACVSSARYAIVPRHYWKTAVEWCDKAIATAGDQWLGYGTPSGGTCQDDQDASHVYPRFYKFGLPAGSDNYATAAFQRMDLDVTRPNAVYDHGLDDLGDPIIRIYKDEALPAHSEMTNYANWFAYYRTRILAVKTVTSITFKELDSKYRVGFHTLFKLDAFLNIADFDASVQKPAWYAKLFGVAIPLGQETPTLDALVRIGEYYRTGSHPQLVGSTDPIVLSCQKNYHLLFTDGYTNQPAVPTTVVGNQDDLVPNYPDFATKPILGLVPGAAWPGPFREDSSGSASNALSDYAMYYWVTDLRPSGAQSANNVPASDRDPASWQHQNFAAVSLGTSGKLPAGNQSVTEDKLKNGTLQWPKPVPNVFKPDNSGVDDLWHAALNGRGRFVNAQSVDELKLGIGKVLADTANTAGARTGAGFQGVNVSSSNNFVYRVRFEPDWAGSLTKVQINPSTGAEVNEIWKAATQLTDQLQIIAGIKDTPWYTERKIVTVDQSGNAVPFLWTKLGADQKDSLFPGKPARGLLVLEFLRGSRLTEGTKVHQFRVRDNALGDIVDSSPVYVGKPNQPYRDSDDPGYSAFKAALAGRAARVYVGANEGMFHAFDDVTGNETWAYVPSPFYRGGSAGGDPKAGLGALAYQDGALPPFKHHFFVDSTARITDVDFGGANWHSIAVGGLGKGGKMYYALDVTQPADITTEAAAASKVLWEFTHADMGYSYGKPMVAKTRAFGGAWLVIVASGYNNASGNGNLYFIRASDGSLVKVMTTGAGSAGTPSGLAHPAGYTKDYRNQLVEQVYAGDLLGNFWRFDVSDADPANWTVGQLGSLVDAGGIAQPVTTPPQIEVDITNGIDRWVFVGTGKLYDDSDAGSTQIETMYAFRDGTANTPWPLPSPVLSRTAVGVVPVSHNSALDFGLATKPDKGWFDDLPAGQRIIVPVQAALSIVAYIGTSPQTDPCLTGLQANVYARQFSDGKSVLQTDPLSPIVESIAIAEGGVGLEFVALETASGSLPDVRLAITLGTTGQVIFIKPKLVGLTPGHRMSWRLLGQ